MTRQEEQDQAAGGRSRTLILGDGTRASASIAVFKAKRGHQFYAYLRFKANSENTKKYVGNVSAASRSESLALGWALVRKLKVVEAFGWRWEGSRPGRETSKSSG